jgi:hypothetical protein
MGIWDSIFGAAKLEQAEKDFYTGLIQDKSIKAEFKGDAGKEKLHIDNKPVNLDELIALATPNNPAADKVTQLKDFATVVSKIHEHNKCSEYNLPIQKLREKVIEKIQVDKVPLNDALTTLIDIKTTDGKPLIDKFIINLPYVDTQSRVSPNTRINIDYPTDDLKGLIQSRPRESEGAIQLLEEEKVLDKEGAKKLRNDSAVGIFIDTRDLHYQAIAATDLPKLKSKSNQLEC